MKMKKKSSPRTSPILQFFASATGNGTSSSSYSRPTSPTATAAAAASSSSPATVDENENDSISAASSTIIRSISQCLDGTGGGSRSQQQAGGTEDDGQEEEGIELTEDERAAIEKARRVDVGGQDHYGPSHSHEEFRNDCSKQNKSPSGFGTGFNNLFKPTGSSKKSKSPPVSPTKSQRSQHNANNSHSTSHKTDPTAPNTTSTGTGTISERYPSHQMGMNPMMPTTPGGLSKSNHTSTNTTSAAIGTNSTSAAAAIAGFWNDHAHPHAMMPMTCATNVDHRDMDDDLGSPRSPLSSSSSLHSGAAAVSPLSSSARAAADAVMGILSRAENFLVASTGMVSPEAGFCSPRNNGADDVSPKAENDDFATQMEGIPEGDEQEHQHQQQQCGDNICGGEVNDGPGENNNSGCFEFEDFGFNAFHLDESNPSVHGNGKDTTINSTADSGVPSKNNDSSWQQQQQPKGYEIRLKSSFSQIKAQKELRKDKKKEQQQQATHTTLKSPLAAAFGRTHPNNVHAYKKSISHPNTMGNNNNAKALQGEIPAVPQGGSRALPEGLPFRELSVPTEIERSVSELTMRSHGAFERHRYASDSRRMAYYAVGRAATEDGGGRSNGGGGGNRRCYFTGQGIPYGMPFYAGSVQQGPRTLVVFCLPAALGLPVFSNLQAMRTLTQFSNAVDRERYLEALPEADAGLLQEMGRRYPEPFDTLPVQVRSPHCWRLFVKFCFFSGLPIAEGEMHYRVRGSVDVFHVSMSSASQRQQQGEEIALSHEVMEAVNGEVSAEILRLPNQKVFDYLKRQYSQQSSKLNEEVFDRKSWELVMPEV